LELIMGEAHFTGLRTIEVKLRSGETREISASTVVINTGARPRIPQLPGIGEISALNSTSIMELEEVPEHLLVIGGGYVGLEFGQMFNRFGSLVTIVQRDDQLLPLEDADVAEEIAEILRQDGVKVILDSTATSVKRTDKDHIKLTVHGPHGDQAFEGSHLLVAAGRVPNTDQLNLEATGIQIDKRGFIPVDEFLQTAVPGVYAVGDVNGGPPFTHISYDDYRILRHNLLERGNSSTAGRLVPYNVFTDPQLGRVGLSEKQAKAQGINYRVAKIPMEWVARALETDERRGMIKAIVDKQDGRILGAAVLSPEGGELMAALQMAIMGEIPYTVLQDGIFAHPTLAESLNTLFANIT
jgi:pyruvate/2-oxoglutarate dehydrogenase complex dihydrolipoamide dehydrogenase (E3) component